MEVIDLTQLDDKEPPPPPPRQRRARDARAPPPPRQKKKRARDEEDSDDDVEITHVEKRERKATTGISTDDAKQRETERLEKTPAMRRGGVGAPKSPLETAEAKWRAAGENAKSRLVRKLFCGCVARGQLDEWRWRAYCHGRC